MKNFKKIISSILLYIMIIGVFFVLPGCYLPPEIDNSIPSTEKLIINFIYVDQGDCIFIELPNGENLMIDCGIGLFDGTDSVSNIQSFLRNKNVQKIDYTVISHPHADHMGAYVEIAEEFQMREVYTTPKTHTTYAYVNFLKKIKEINGNLYFPKPGEYIIFDNNMDLSLQVMSVIEENSILNNCSLVVKLKYQENTILFLGDTEKLGEQVLTNSKHDFSSDIIKVGHHGSKNSSNQYFLDKVNASYGVITTTKNVSGTGHPHFEAINRLLASGIDLYETGVYENIIITCDGKNYQFSSLKDGIRTDNILPSRKSKNEKRIY